MSINERTRRPDYFYRPCSTCPLQFSESLPANYPENMTMLRQFWTTIGLLRKNRV